MDTRSESCDPCRFQGKRTKAKTFCESCREYYCKQCTKHHLKFRMSMGHRLVKLVHEPSLSECVQKLGVVDKVFEHKDLNYTMDYLCPKATSYKLSILETEASRRCMLSGLCKFVIQEHSLSLTDLKDPEVTYEWPYTSIRKVGSMENKVFFFESGRRTKSGEGRFVLLTHDASIIHSLVMNSIKKLQSKSVD